MKEKSFSQRLPVLLAVLFAMTMIMCAMYVPVSAASPLEGGSSTSVYLPIDPPVSLPAILADYTSEYYVIKKNTGDSFYIVFVPNGVDPNIVEFSSSLVFQNFTYWQIVNGVISEPVLSSSFTVSKSTIASLYYGSDISLPDFSNVTFEIESMDLEVFTTSSDGILNVFSEVGVWIVSSISSLMLLFYSAETGLTFVGVLAVAGLAISVVLLLVALISRWLKFK